MKIHLHTYNLYCFHINTSNPYDETEGKSQGWVTLTYLSRSQRLINPCSHNLYRFRIHINQLIELIKLYFTFEDCDLQLFCYQTLSS